MVTQCLCESGSARDGCRGRSVPTTDETDDSFRRELFWQCGQEFEEKKRTGMSSGDVCNTGEVALCLRCLNSESVVQCRCTRLSLHTSSSFANGIEFDDETKKLRRLKLGVKMKMAVLRQKWVRKGATHLRNGPLPRRGAQLRSGWVSKGVAPSRNGSVSRGFAHRRNGRVPMGTALLRKKNCPESNGSASASGDGAKSDPADSPDVIVNNSPAHEIIDGVEVAASVEPHPVDVQVVADDGEVVEDVVAEEIVGGGENIDKDVARSTVDLGVAGDPIVLGVLSPAEYTDLVFNVVLYLPLVDADHQ